MILQKIDYYGQVSLAVLMVFSTPFYFYFGFLAGLFIIGCWQLLSAVCNTGSFNNHALHKEISQYWIFTAIVLILLLLCFPLAEAFSPDDIQVLAGAAIIGSIPLAYHYLNIYKKLIRRLGLKKELRGLIKS